MHVARFDLLIDGYNLMHVAGFARERYGPREFQQQRDRFLDWLWKRIPPQLRDRTVIAFDAGEADGDYVQQAMHNDLRLFYSPRGLEADDLIEELIELHSNPKQLQVISSDHRLHKAARRRKATCLDSEAFVSLMASIAREASERRRAEAELSKPVGELPEETAAWLRVFAEADELLRGSIPPAATPAARPASSSSTRRHVLPLGDGQPPVPPGATPTSKPASSKPGSGSRHRSKLSGRSQKQPPAIPPPATAPIPPPAPASKTKPLPNIPNEELAFWQERLQDLLGPAG